MPVTQGSNIACQREGAAGLVSELGLDGNGLLRRPLAQPGPRPPHEDRPQWGLPRRSIMLAHDTAVRNDTELRLVIPSAAVLRILSVLGDQVTRRGGR
jgi:hypothetical protein